ncbi:MAG: type I-E CRISPR-associated protein Cas7/Cse4/CasC [Thiothrix sp.]|nr:MAG: type I-E CRISPR-associated protein Cas7/Cse4/CasC [Thiothrix sp.]
MSRFVQLHLLTSYPPANLNRDDLGRPKTAMMGGEPRLRVSSQSLKRAWRTSEVFEDSLKGHIGVRTKEMGIEIFKQLKEKGVAKKDAIDWSKAIAAQFGKLKAANKDNEMQELEIEQLAHFSPEEQQAIQALITQLAERKTKPEVEELELLRKTHTAADIALFGRMLAAKPIYNTEAAAQVAHAISVHSVVVEDDFFTAVDDLNKGEDDAGASHLGETEFAAGLFYLYLCIDKALLIKNLSGDESLANKTLAALIESATTVSPSGKQNSFASRARTSYLLCETGNQQPRSLSVAFLKPISKGNMLLDAKKRLDKTLYNMDEV